ncbi:MAG: hypothetical protein LBG97_08915 [Coriobacteriales bacterium]|jgi:hypothetical protein|nr:hypothetical protein [Coriobacteriales bacterium]
MEKNQVSSHSLKSDYSIKGKIKDAIIGWVIYFAFLFVTRIPEISNLLLQTETFAFLTSDLWYFFAVFMIAGTIITLVKKHPFVKLNIYNTGVGFVDKGGIEKYLDYEKIELSYGKMQESITIELIEDKKTSYDYAWKEFTQPDILRNNLERYGTIK